MWDWCFPVRGLPRAGAHSPVPLQLPPPAHGAGQSIWGPGLPPCHPAHDPAASWSQEHSRTPHASPVPTVSSASATVGTLQYFCLFKESPRVKGLKRELAGESSFPKPWSPRGVFWCGGLSGLLAELGDHAGRLECCPHSTEHGVEARKELPQAPPALVLFSSAAFHRDLGGHAPDSGSGAPGSWGHWAGCGCQGGQRSVGLDAWGARGSIGAVPQAAPRGQGVGPLGGKAGE